MENLVHIKVEVVEDDEEEEEEEMYMRCAEIKEEEIPVEIISGEL